MQPGSPQGLVCSCYYIFWGLLCNCNSWGFFVAISKTNPNFFKSISTTTWVSKQPLLQKPGLKCDLYNQQHHFCAVITPITTRTSLQPLLYYYLEDFTAPKIATTNSSQGSILHPNSLHCCCYKTTKRSMWTLLQPCGFHFSHFFNHKNFTGVNTSTTKTSLHPWPGFLVFVVITIQSDLVVNLLLSFLLWLHRKLNWT